MNRMGAGRDRPDCRHHVVEPVARTGIDEHDAIASDLHRDVGAGAGDQVEVRPYPQDSRVPRRTLRWRSPGQYSEVRSRVRPRTTQPRSPRCAARDSSWNLLVATDSEEATGWIKSARPGVSRPTSVRPAHAAASAGTAGVSRPSRRRTRCRSRRPPPAALPRRRRWTFSWSCWTTIGVTAGCSPKRSV